MTVSRPVILILAANMGGGHLNLAQSLKEVLEPEYEVVITDPQPDIVDDSYTFVSRHLVRYLTLQYTLTDNEPASLWLHRILTLTNYRSIYNIMERTQPRLVIVTHAFLSYAAARVVEHHQPRIPIVFQLTDLGQLHTTWFTEKHADAYLAPTREIFAQALRHDIEKNHLYITGRPIRQQFLEASSDSRKEILASLNLNPEVLTIFLQGGAKGSTRVDRIIENWLSTGIPMQVILAAGNNTQMAARYANIKQVHVLPYTKLIAPYMAATDVIAGKAGASSISEAFILEKPFLVTSFIPGQETANLQFLQEHNLGWIRLKQADQRELLTSIVRDPAIIAEKVESIRRYKAWNREANQSIGPIIRELITCSTMA